MTERPQNTESGQDDLILDFNLPVDVAALEQLANERYKSHRFLDRALSLGSIVVAEAAAIANIIPDESATATIITAVPVYIWLSRDSKRIHRKSLAKARANLYETDEDKIISIPKVDVVIEKTPENEESFNHLRNLFQQLTVEGTNVRYDVIHTNKELFETTISQLHEDAGGLLWLMINSEFGPIDPRIVARKINNTIHNNDLDPELDFSNSAELVKYQAIRRLIASHRQLGVWITESTHPCPEVMIFNVEKVINSLTDASDIGLGSFNELKVIAKALINVPPSADKVPPIDSNDVALIDALITIYSKFQS